MTKDDKVLEHLYKIKFIGPFPEKVDVLLTKVSNALDEARLVNPKLSSTELVNLLKKNNILIFKDVNDYYQWKVGRRIPRNRP